MAELDFRDDRAKGLLEAYEGGRVAGRIAYFALPAALAALVAVHTVVEPEYEGQGVAGALVREFYAMGEREGVPVVPLCPYAAKWAQRHPDEAPVPSAELVEAAEQRLKADPSLW
ncbi:GNAT family N-acetyltransferase [Streptomyces sp. NPDC051907]|uniref:GNAT family N-acetyltransferase n=1 Tax=Streptomyces sp. NPDC051907 TaxID=3155284 RepID=UPI0034325BF8